MVDAEKTKMQESLEIWQNVSETEAFADSILILFLNKVDLFREKIAKVPLKDTFKVLHVAYCYLLSRLLTK